MKAGIFGARRASPRKCCGASDDTWARSMRRSARCCCTWRKRWRGGRTRAKRSKRPFRGRHHLVWRIPYILFQAVPLENGAELLFETEFPVMLFLILDVLNHRIRAG